MSTTITVRAAEPLREVLNKKAAASGKTVSEVVREILEEALAERPLRVRGGHLRGRLRFPMDSADATLVLLAEALDARDTSRFFDLPHAAPA